MSLRETYQSRKDLLASNLASQGVTGYTGSDGLSTLINAVLEISPAPTPNYDAVDIASNKDILSYADSESATLTAQLLDGSISASVSGVSVDFYHYVDGVNDVLIGSDNTNSSGVASTSYISAGLGNIEVYVKRGRLSSETYEIEDCLYYNTDEVSRTTTQGSTIYDNNLSQALPSKCEISFDLYSDNNSDTGEHRFFLLPKSQYSSGTTQPTNAIYVDAFKTKINIGKRESSTVGLYTDLAYGSGSYRNFKIIKDGNDLTFYIDDNLIGTVTISWIDNYSDYTFSMMRWSTSGTSKLRNVKIKPI